MTDLVITADNPNAFDVSALLQIHLAFARGASPPEDSHALDVHELLADDVSFFSVREHGQLLGVGALKRLDATHAEVKSMHTATHARERGIGRTMLEHLIGVARRWGCSRISLETGSMEAFAPSRALYEAAGFTPCDPFGDYRPSPNSTFMTMVLSD